MISVQGRRKIQRGDILYGSIVVVTTASALITFSLSSHYFCCIFTSFNSYLYSQLLYFSDICICVFARVCICANFVLYLYWSPPHCPLSSAALWSPAPFWSGRHQKRDMLIRDLKQIQNQLPVGWGYQIGGRGIKWFGYIIKVGCWLKCRIRCEISKL